MHPHPNDSTSDPHRFDDAYWAGCEARIGPFVDAHYRWPGVWKMHRAALGLDLLKAPANMLLAPAALSVQVVARLMQRLGARRLARLLGRVPLGFRTAVESALAEHLQRDVLERRVPTGAAAVLVADYAETRRAASDIAAALIVGVVGLLAVHRFTPGSVSAGEELAANVVHYTAVHHFILGDWLGGWYYRFFPPHTPLWSQIVGVLVVAALMALFSAFSGLFTDPLQARFGVHEVRLERWLDSCRRLMDGTDTGVYRPRDPYVARLLDLADALKGIIS